MSHTTRMAFLNAILALLLAVLMAEMMETNSRLSPKYFYINS